MVVVIPRISPLTIPDNHSLSDNQPCMRSIRVSVRSSIDDRAQSTRTWTPASYTKLVLWARDARARLDSIPPARFEFADHWSGWSRRVRRQWTIWTERARGKTRRRFPPTHRHLRCRHVLVLSLSDEAETIAAVRRSVLVAVTQRKAREARRSNHEGRIRCSAGTSTPASRHHYFISLRYNRSRTRRWRSGSNSSSSSNFRRRWRKHA